MIISVNLTQALIHSLICSRLNYCISILRIINSCTVTRIESIQRHTKLLLFKLNRSDHVSISAIMRSLAWLKCN